MSASHIRTASVLTTWRKSTYSGGDNGDCIEVADHIPGVVPVRDSTAPHGPALVIPAASWAAFIAEVKSGSLS
ncbi:DUF397 domain-containing protein [Actinacidiphila soli]|jgi:hypothetical protein|uniref:DUF397 domain-containing protein n=1 Tax=Actinacidiphila soli TaxID=2487275 RepID=UPI000FCBFFFC|nr:DUF397 domain-containing protein [Actinacidiphila soli]